MVIEVPAELEVLVVVMKCEMLYAMSYWGERRKTLMACLRRSVLAAQGLV